MKSRRSGATPVGNLGYAIVVASAVVAMAGIFRGGLDPTVLKVMGLGIGTAFALERLKVR